MSGAAIVRTLLAAHAPVTALVPAAKIFAGLAPQGTLAPAVSVHTIGDYEQHDVRRQAKGLIRERVQVTVLAGNYVQMKAILRAAALGPGVYNGTTAGFRVRSVLPAGGGPEIPPGDDKIFEQSRDFVVTFTEAN